MKIEDIPERVAILIIGPPLSQKKSILYQLITKKLKKNIPILFITTDHFPSDIESDLQKENISYKEYESSGNLKFIDCYSAQTQNTLFNTKSIKRVSGPLALNEISIVLSEIEKDYYQKDKRPVIIFQSLSTMLIYSKPEAIERFVQVIIARTKNSGGSIFFVIEEGMHDPKIIISLEHLMDGVIELKDDKLNLKLEK